MIVSVTGATGFIGKRLVQRLHAGIVNFALVIGFPNYLIACVENICVLFLVLLLDCR